MPVVTAPLCRCNVCTFNMFSHALPVPPTRDRSCSERIPALPSIQPFRMSCAVVPPSSSVRPSSGSGSTNSAADWRFSLGGSSFRGWLFRRGLSRVELNGDDFDGAPAYGFDLTGRRTSSTMSVRQDCATHSAVCAAIQDSPPSYLSWRSPRYDTAIFRCSRRRAAAARVPTPTGLFWLAATVADDGTTMMLAPGSSTSLSTPFLRRMVASARWTHFGNAPRPLGPLRDEVTTTSDRPRCSRVGRRARKEDREVVVLSQGSPNAVAGEPPSSQKPHGTAGP